MATRDPRPWPIQWWYPSIRLVGLKKTRKSCQGSRYISVENQTGRLQNTSHKRYIYSNLLGEDKMKTNAFRNLKTLQAESSIPWPYRRHSHILSLIEHHYAHMTMHTINLYCAYCVMYAMFNWTNRQLKEYISLKGLILSKTFIKRNQTQINVILKDLWSREYRGEIDVISRLINRKCLTHNTLSCSYTVTCPVC